MGLLKIIQPDWKHIRPMFIGLVSAFCVALIIAIYIMQAPSSDIMELVQFLGFSSIPSLVVGYGLFMLGQHHLRHIRLKVTLAYGLGVLIALVNVYITSRLMFFNGHDFALLVLLLVFSALLSISFGVILAASITESLKDLITGAKELASGSLSTRVPISHRDELSDLSHAFNTMASRLEDSFNRQKEMEQARRDLIAAVSHDLRTPLTSIRVMVEALADKVVTDQETIDRYHTNIQNQITSLSHLIDNFFELSKMDSVKWQLHIEPVCVSDLISDTLESMRAQAVVKEIHLDGQVTSGLPSVMIETAKIQRVLYNLVQNAIRHTNQGGHIFITVKPATSGIQVDVIDNGEGINPEDLPHVFEEFYRGEKSRSRDTGGAGLGLSIAKRIICAHHGDMWVESRLGQGSKFSFTLPELV